MNFPLKIPFSDELTTAAEVLFQQLFETFHVNHDKDDARASSYIIRKDEKDKFPIISLSNLYQSSDKGLTLETSALKLFTVANSRYQLSQYY